MTALAILADDLTGAADCAVAAARGGLPAEVRFTLPWDDGGAGDGVVAWDLDTRNRPAPEAAERTRRATEAVGGAPVYLKIDSTLRGPLAALVGAARGNRTAVVAPALPALGRRVTGGRLHVGDEPGARVADRLDGLPVQELALEDLRAGRAAAGHGVLVCDAETDADLDRLVADLAGADVLWVGSAGLAGALARSGTLAGAPAAVTQVPAAPVLTIAGSFAAETRAQVEALLAAPGVVAVPADADDLAAGRGIPAAARAVAAALEAGRHPVVHVHTDPAALAHLRGSGDAAVRDRSVRIAAALAEIAVAGGDAAGALVLTGGETARTVCDALGITGVRIAGEVEPGVPHGRAVGREAALVTKAGAFGSPTTLTATLTHLTGGTT